MNDTFPLFSVDVLSVNVFVDGYVSWWNDIKRASVTGDNVIVIMAVPGGFLDFILLETLVECQRLNARGEKGTLL